MQSRHRVSPAGIELIKRFEGFRAHAARLPDGRHVIGYGHVRSARAGAVVTEADAEDLLRYDLRAVEAALNALVFTPLCANQIDALAAFVFSVGVDAFRRSGVLRRINEGDLLGAAVAIESWRRAEFEGEPIVVDALIRRRAAEKLLFLTPPGGFVVAPSSVLKPELDYAAQLDRAPVRAAGIVTPLEGEETAPERTPDADDPPPPPEPSPAQLAAEKVARRLEALFADDPEPAPLPAAPRASSPEPAADPVPEPPVPADPPLAEPPLTEAEAPESPADPDQAFDRRIARTEPLPGETPSRPSQESGWLYAAIGGGGLVLFVLALSIIWRAQDAGASDLSSGSVLLGVILAAVGIVTLCAAVWRWLRTLGEDRSR